MTHAGLMLGPLLLLGGYLSPLAFAEEMGALPAMPHGNPASLEYLLTLGPYGALVWGAYLLGRGLTLTVRVELSDRDRELLAARRSPEPTAKT